MKKEQITRPVSVSHVIPVYFKGSIRYWDVSVEYDYDIAVNSAELEMWRKVHRESPELFNIVPKLYDLLMPVFKKEVIIPDRRKLIGFSYDSKSDKSVLLYRWNDGLLGRGAEHAWQFRLEILKEIMNNKINTKAK